MVGRTLSEAMKVLSNKDIRNMGNCDHWYDDKHPNCYHLEGSVLKHTKMVYKAYRRSFSESNDVLEKAIMYHDLGKVYTRYEDHDRKRVIFKGHEGYSFYLVNKLRNISVSKIVAMHGFIYGNVESFLSIKSFTEFTKRYYFSNKVEDYVNLLKMLYVDVVGRETDEYIVLENKALLIQIEKLIEDSEDIYEVGNTINNNRPTTYLTVGVPACGKTTYINNHFTNNANYLSRDDIVIDVAMKNNNGKMPNYTKAFDLVSSDDRLNNEVNTIWQRKLSKYSKLDMNIVVDMTNVSVKSRNMIAHRIKRNFNVVALVLHTDYDNIIMNNVLRDGKKIPSDVIQSFIKRFRYPCNGIGDNVDNIIDVPYGNL